MGTKKKKGRRTKKGRTDEERDKGKKRMDVGGSGRSLFHENSSQYLHNTSCVNYEKPTRSQRHTVEPGVSRTRSNRDAAVVMVQFRSGSKRPIIRKSHHK